MNASDFQPVPNPRNRHKMSESRENPMKPTIIFIFLAAVSSTSCATTPSPQPSWLTSKITTLQNGPVGNPPLSVWQYQYRGQVVYYFPPQCCDQYSELYDAKQQRLCAPDGGMTGQGDDKCPDFYQTRTAGKLLWRDERKKPSN